MAQTNEVVTHLVIDARGALRVLDEYADGMQEAAGATDNLEQSTEEMQRAVDIAATKMRKALEAKNLGIPIMRETVSALNREQAAWERLAAKTDPLMMLQLRQVRERERAIATAVNSVSAGYATEAQALSVLSRLEDQHAANLAEKTAALDRVASHTSAVTAVTHANTSAVDLNSAAHMANAQAMRAANAQRTNLLFQLQDIGVSLAGGMNPLMVFAQQGSQISMIYGPGEGGLGRALQETGNIAVGFVTKLWPVAAVVGVGTAAVAGLTQEINRNGEQQVTWQNTVTAAWQLAAEAITGFVGPAINTVVGWFGDLWGMVAPHIATFANGVIGRIAYAVQVVGALWNGLPLAIADAIVTTGNVIVGGIELAINRAAELLDQFIARANGALGKFGMQIPSVGRVDFGGFSNPWAGSMESLGRDIQLAGDALSRDYVGEAIGAISERARELAAAQVEVADATSGAGGAMDAASAAADELEAEMNRANAAAEQMRDTFGTIMASLFDGPMNDADAFFDKIATGFASVGNDNLDEFFGAAA